MKIDCHVHVVGNGTGGTGCWYRPRGLTRYGVPLMLGAVGLPRSALAGDLDRIYAEQMVKFVRESSLDAAVILAQDEPYRDNGEMIADTGSFSCPTITCCGWRASTASCCRRSRFIRRGAMRWRSWSAASPPTR